MLRSNNWNPGGRKIPPVPPGVHVQPRKTSEKHLNVADIRPES